MNNKIDRNLKYTIATHAAEKMKPSKEALRLCRENTAGHIDADSAVKLIIQKYGVKSGTLNNERF